jgi:hypothetical protein
MPFVPYSPVPAVLPEGQIAPQRIQASPADFGAQAGQALQQDSGELWQQAVVHQQLANETQVNDVINNKFFPAFQDMYQKYYSLQGKDAVDQLPTYQQSMRDLVQQYREQLGNPMQQRSFDQETQRRLQYEFRGMGRYADQQNKVYQAQTFDGAVQRQISTAADKYNDPNAIIMAAQGIGLATSKFYQANGASPEYADMQTAKYYNQLFGTVIQRRLQAGDITGAISLYQEGMQKNFITGSGATQIERVLKPFQEVHEAQNAFSVATGGPQTTQVASGYTAAGLTPSLGLATMYIESGGIPTAKNPTPGSTSKGLFGMTDGTWAAQGGTPEERGNIAKDVAYNAQYDAKNAQGLQTTLGRSPMDWEIYLAHQQGLGGAQKLLQNPAAKAADLVGKDAVVNNGGSADMSAAQFLQAIKGRYQTAASMFNQDGTLTAACFQKHYEEVLANVRANVLQADPGDPAAVGRAVNNAAQQMGIALRSARMETWANEAAVMQAIDAPNGPKTWPEFLANPQGLQAYLRLSQTDPSLYDSVTAQLSKNATGTQDPPATAKTQELFHSSLGLETTDRQEFANRDLSALRGEIPLAQWQRLSADQKDIRSQTGETGSVVNVVHALSIANPFMARAGVRVIEDPVSKDPASLQYNAAVGRYRQAIETWEQNNSGKKPTDMELRKIAQETFPPPGFDSAPTQKS